MLIQEPRKRMKHNYTCELELKSILIRVKNGRNDIGTEKDNAKINKYIIWHNKINNKKYVKPAKRNITKAKLKAAIIKLSEQTRDDTVTYERFGEIILLMIKNILKKPNLSGYTYKDDFYSDAVYKILKYLGNFNHLMISERTRALVNAFAYVSQIIHNSILFIINSKKKEMENHKKEVERIVQQQNLGITFNNWYADIREPEQTETLYSCVTLTSIEGNLRDELIKLEDVIEKSEKIKVIYPIDYLISFDEYNELKDLLKGKVSIVRAKPPEPKEDEIEGAE